jgi:hypothetical protein
VNSSVGQIARGIAVGPQLAALLVGTWSLVSVDAVSVDGTEYPFGSEPVGMLTYDRTGRMAVQVMQAGRPLFASDDQDDGTVDEIAAAFTGYVAYYGTYSVDDHHAVVTHHVTASMFPNWVGTDQRREVSLDGARLTLSTRFHRQDGTEVIYRVNWRRAD